MYHIKEDKRMIKSSELLYKGLIDCMSIKEYSKITIADISEASTVGRATFYRNFDNIADILHWKLSQHFIEKLSGYVDLNPYPEKKNGFLLHVFNYWTKNSEVLELLLKIDRIDIIYKCFKEYSHIIIDHMKKQVLVSDFNYDYFIAIRFGILVGIIDTWIKNGKKDSAEELVNIVESQLHFATKDNLIF